MKNSACLTNNRVIFNFEPVLPDTRIVLLVIVISYYGLLLLLLFSLFFFVTRIVGI